MSSKILFSLLTLRDRETERETDRQTDKQRQRQRQRQTDKKKDRQTDRQTMRQRQRQRQRERETWGSLVVERPLTEHKDMGSDPLLGCPLYIKCHTTTDGRIANLQSCIVPGTTNEHKQKKKTSHTLIHQLYIIQVYILI